MPHASVTDSVLVAAPPDVVWSVITEPEQIPALDPRLTLVSTSGQLATPGSGYVVHATRGTRSVDMQYRVIEAHAPVTLSMGVTVRGKVSASQEATLTPHGNGTLLSWTTRTAAPFGTAALARRMMRKEMRTWLAAVAALSMSRN